MLASRWLRTHACGVQVRSGDLAEPLELGAGDEVVFTIVEGEDGRDRRISGEEAPGVTLVIAWQSESLAAPRVWRGLGREAAEPCAAAAEGLQPAPPAPLASLCLCL